jgi:hypothetical protein
VSSLLPKGARFKGTRNVVIQDLKFTAYNTKFLIKRYESSDGIIEGRLPAGYEGSEFGPELRAYVHLLYFQARVPYNKIEKILHGMGVQISDSEICRIVNRENSELVREHEKARLAGLKKCDFVQVDDTGARIMDRNAHTIVTSNPYFCHFYTSESKDRMSVLKALSGERGLIYMINKTALDILKGKVAQKYHRMIRQRKKDRLLTHDQLRRRLLGLDLPSRVLEEVEVACAIAGYRSLGEYRPTVLVSDDATNFKRIFRYHQLCWIHEIRHYRVIHTFCQYHEQLITDHIDQMRQIYRRIKDYQKQPSPKEKTEIEIQFDNIFEKQTPFNALNEQLTLSRKRKKGLLLVLDHPHVVIHNNESETDLRERVLKRKISSGNRSLQGVRAWDLHLSLVHTTRKLKISYWAFLKDRFKRKFEIPRLDRTIRAMPPPPACHT